jgi:hypothetical protein
VESVELAAPVDETHLDVDDDEEEETTAVDVAAIPENVKTTSGVSVSRAPNAPSRQPPKAPSVRAAEASPATSASVRPSKSVAPMAPRGRSSSVPVAPFSSTTSGKTKVSEGAPVEAKGQEPSIPLAPRAVSVTAFGASASGPNERQSSPPNHLVERGSKPPPGPMASAQSGASKLAPAHGAGPLVLPKTAMRVAVRVSARDDQLYVVRPLPSGQRIPVGAREAWLVFDEASAMSAGVVPGKN